MIKEIIIFASGAGIGAGVTVLVLKDRIAKREQKIADEKIKSHDKYIEELERRTKIAENAVRESYLGEEGNEKPDKKAEKDEKTGEKKEKSREKNKIMQIDYTSYYQNRAENEHPEEDHGYVETLEDENERINDPEIRKRPPKVIALDDFEDPEYEHHDKIQLYFYTDDGILSTEEDEILDDVGTNLGMVLETSGFESNDNKVLYVRNFNLGVDYEIDKVFGAYADRM